MSVSGGFGVDWKVDVSSTLTSVEHVREIEFPDEEHELTEVTAHDSPGGYTEWLATGRIRTEEFTVKLTWDDALATHQEIRTHHGDGTALNMSLTAPDGQETLTFDGLVRKLKRMSPQDGSYDMEVTILPTGQITLS